jgi:hypothetical protein
MAWLDGKNNHNATSAAAQADGGKYTFDVPVKFRVRGIAETVQGTLLHIAVSGCRLRSWILLERGTGLALDWRLSDGKLLTLAGVVAARYGAKSGGVGFEYAVALEALPEREADLLAREAAMLERRSAAARSYDTSLIDISQFTGYRVPNDFTLTYRVEGARIDTRIAAACDVTGNALRLRCDERLHTKQVVLLRLRLPDTVLDVHKGSSDDDQLVPGPMGHRNVPRKHLRRPFEELTLRARVAAKIKDSKGRPCYELELLDVDGLAREEIARYIHASQLAGLKR